MNCHTHQNVTATYMCTQYGHPLCKTCYHLLYIQSKNEHLCVNCFEHQVKNALKKVEDLVWKIWKEFIIIVLGFVVGLVLGLDIYFGFGILCPVATKIIFVPIILSFTFASLPTIIKSIKNVYKKERSSSSPNIEGTVIAQAIIDIVLSPFITIGHIYKRSKDLQTLHALIKQGNDTLLALNNFSKNNIDFPEPDFPPNEEILKTIKNR